jgi:hypothetical protein
MREQIETIIKDEADVYKTADTATAAAAPWRRTSHHDMRWESLNASKL